MIDKINLTDGEIQENYQEFLKFVGDVFSGERKTKLLKMYSDDNDSLGLSLATAPHPCANIFIYVILEDIFNT